MLFEKLSFQGQNYGMEGIQLTVFGKLNSLDKILLVVLLLLIIALLYMFLLVKKAYKLEKKNGKNVAKLKEEIENTVSERDVLMGEYKALLDKYNVLKKKRDKLHKMAYNDSLTDLPNKVALHEVIDSAFATLRKEEKFILMHIDLDNFKIVNDTLGHSYGDELILDVSHRIKEAIDENDTLARYGSDEFLIFSQNIDDIGEYEEKVKKVQKVFSYPFVLSNKEFELLLLFARNKNIVLSRIKIEESIYGIDSFNESNVIDVHIRNLRKKIEKDTPIIETIRGVGYVVKE